MKYSDVEFQTGFNCTLKTDFVPGYFFNTMTQRFETCSQNCYKCSDLKNCLECKAFPRSTHSSSFFEVFEGICRICEGDTPYYDDFNKKCSSCAIKGCALCDDSKLCLKCQRDDFYLDFDNVTCVESCKNGTYGNNFLKKCFPYHKNCKFIFLKIFLRQNL